MKQKLAFLLLTMLCLAVTAAIMIELIYPKTDLAVMQSEDKIHIVTTIYPVYLIGTNLTDQMDKVDVKSLINRNTGCLHDYQLTAEDMKVIATADVLVINGGGMEAFLEDIVASYPKLTIIDASQGITLLSEQNHSEYNTHVWLNPVLYGQQIEKVRDGLTKYMKASSKLSDSNTEEAIRQINQNALTYTTKIQQLESEFEDFKKSVVKSSDQQQVVIFHDSFAYLANRVGMTVAFSVELEADTALSAANIADIVRAVRDKNIRYLFTEEQYSDAIPKQIAEETGAKVYVIDSVVIGDGTKDSYIKAMENNLEILKEATQ